jgi:prepilin-type N-terminal cleavage/methylation domain-containing protein
MKTLSKGFTLVELLIVIAVLLIITAMAIPNLLRSKIAANQASAVAAVRLVTVAEVAYSTTYNNGFSTTLISLGPSATPGATPTSTTAILIDSILATGTKSGYSFTYSPGPADSTGRVNSYRVTAVPLDSWQGTFSYYSDQSGVIRQNATTTASSTDSPIGG